MRPDLVGLSDDQLAARYSAAGQGPEAAAIAAEAARRDLLARLFPGGQLLGDLSDVGDDELAWCMQYATSEELFRIAAEMDRRNAVDLPEPADTGDAVANMLADRDALAEAMAPAPDPEDWGRLADDESFAAEAAAIAAAHEEDGSERDERHTITRREARALYDEYVSSFSVAAPE
ncbi:hypothetical protein ACGFZB_25100 [Streptomyces cinerochromogenes]|uniref:Uncharacterized protein n=1 Tax=Streptomyces cinerochromogenes TaxID=66422 RepID=A0ABW7B8Z5_9ACTN